MSTAEAKLKLGLGFLILNNVHNLKTSIFRLPFFSKSLENHRPARLPVFIHFDQLFSPKIELGSLLEVLGLLVNRFCHCRLCDGLYNVWSYYTSCFD